MAVVYGNKDRIRLFDCLNLFNARLVIEGL